MAALTSAKLHTRQTRGAASAALLQPLLKAYLLAYLGIASPKLIGILVALLRRRASVETAIRKIRQTLLDSASVHRFPAFCGVLAGCSTLLRQPLGDILSKAAPSTNAHTTARLSRFLAALIGASFSFALLNGGHRKTLSTYLQDLPVTRRSRERASSVESIGSDIDESIKTLPPNLVAGRTIDLTCFAVVRALDAIFCQPEGSAVPSGAKRRNIPWSTVMFTLSCASVMHAWFYSPSRLPRSYNAWISRAAQLDPRVIEALRRCRRGEFAYGRETGQAPLLGELAEDEGLPYSYGDPATTIPVRCEIVNASVGLGSGGLTARQLAKGGWRAKVMRWTNGSCGCERHALLRFAQGWYFAAFMYFPLQFIVLARKLQALRAKGSLGLQRFLTELRGSVLSASRSASFLGAFIFLVYYGVCLGRTRLGPRVLDVAMRIPALGPLFGIDHTSRAGRKLMANKEERHRVISMMLDGGLAPSLGCWLCGLSLLIEQQRRRVEIMLFVAPRAVGAWVPRRYHRMHLWKEQTIFALSTAFVLTVVQERPDKVRGVLGKVLGDALNA